MPAIITSDFRIENANNFKEAIADTNSSVYLGIGKPDPWTASLAQTTDTIGDVPTPVDTLVEKNDFWQNLIALKRVSASDVINLCPRFNWTSGETYVAWDDADDLIYNQPYYVITDEFKVYKCIRAGAGSTQNKPTQTTFLPTAEGDGYIWKYMYSVQAVYQKFLTNNYMPVKTILEDPGTGSADEGQWNVQENSSPGKIYRYVVTNGGTGYNPASPPAVTISGDGSGAIAVATVSSGGVVTAVTVSTSGSGFEVNAGSNYSVVNVTIAAPVSGTTATARAVLSPQGGHGSDATSELGGFFVGIGVSLVGTEGGTDFIINNFFRQLGIIKNPYDEGTTSISTATTLSSLKSMVVTAASGLQIGDYITGVTSGAKAFIDSYDSSAGIIQYHQNDKTAYIPFQVSEAIRISMNTGPGNNGVISSLSEPEVERFTGEVLFVENRVAINRAAAQIEDIKIIIEF